MSEHEYNDLVSEAQKVEEALKEFISTIIQHYRDYDIDPKYLTRFEREISEAETLLDVFAIMKNMYDKLMENIEKITKNMLDCSEVSIEKDPTLKNIVAKYENEIKVHVRLEQELKSIIKQHEVKMKEKDDIIKELHKNIEKKEVKTLQKRNSELSLNLHDEIKQKLKIFKRLKKSSENNTTSFFPLGDTQNNHSAHNTKRKLSSSVVNSSKRSALKLSFEMAKSPKSLSRKGSIVEGNHIGSLFNSMNESKSPCAGTSVSNLFQGRKDRKKKPTSIILNFEDDLKRYFNGYFSSKQAFMSTNNSINKSLCENRRGKDRVGRREYAPG